MQQYFIIFVIRQNQLNITLQMIMSFQSPYQFRRYRNPYIFMPIR
jgi:hypothetical protein